MDNYDEMTIRELQELCHERNLPTGRSRADVIATLRGSTDHVFLQGSVPEVEVEVEQVEESSQEDAPKGVAFAVYPELHRVVVAYEFNGSLRNGMDDKLQKHTEATVRASGYTTSGSAALLRAQGGQTLYAVEVK